MFARYTPLSLLKWCALYCFCAALPGSLLLLLPPEALAERVATEKGEKITAGQVLRWFPAAMIGAAVVTLLTGIVCALLNALATLIAQDLTGSEDAPVPPSARRLWLAGAIPTLYRCLRIAVMLTGMGLVGLSVALVWTNIVNDTLTEGINRVVLALGGGAGLATGAAFYRN